MRHMTNSPGYEPISTRPGLCCGMGEKERSCHCHSRHLNSPWPCKILKVDQRTSESSQAWHIYLHTNTHILYKCTWSIKSARGRRGRKRRGIRTRCRLDRQQAAFLRGIKRRTRSTYSSAHKPSPNWRLSMRRPLQFSGMATICVNRIFSAFLIPN